VPVPQWGGGGACPLCEPVQNAGLADLFLNYSEGVVFPSRINPVTPGLTIYCLSLGLFQAPVHHLSSGRRTGLNL